ncbi:unnamed protein product [Cyprideis torosa]|uniref:Uncharacterized protein n=1 Tax=Cyprideis torosa TaxID=163714 RepID=A0A7R8WMM6_9CRUS|nr:unnamed protein product [Cyprideis torosa]CAG0905399.1 unnamed protein product [Cyprideis torosa]
MPYSKSSERPREEEWDTDVTPYRPMEATSSKPYARRLSFPKGKGIGKAARRKARAAEADRAEYFKQLEKTNRKITDLIRPTSVPSSCKQTTPRHPSDCDRRSMPPPTGLLPAAAPSAFSLPSQPFRPAPGPAQPLPIDDADDEDQNPAPSCPGQSLDFGTSESRSGQAPEVSRLCV